MIRSNEVAGVVNSLGRAQSLGSIDSVISVIIRCPDPAEAARYCTSYPRMIKIRRKSPSLGGVLHWYKLRLHAEFSLTYLESPLIVFPLFPLNPLNRREEPPPFLRHNNSGYDRDYEVRAGYNEKNYGFG